MNGTVASPGSPEHKLTAGPLPDQEFAERSESAAASVAHLTRPSPRVHQFKPATRSRCGCHVLSQQNSRLPPHTCARDVQVLRKRSSAREAFSPLAGALGEKVEEADEDEAEDDF